MTTTEPGSTASTAERDEVGDDQAAGVAKSSRTGMKPHGGGAPGDPCVYREYRVNALEPDVAETKLEGSGR
jgi:hypothetical protein